MKTINFKLAGLTCAACAKLAGRRLEKIPGVSTVRIEAKTGETILTCTNDLDESAISRSLVGTNYKAII